MKKIFIKNNTLSYVKNEIEILLKLKSRHVVNYFQYFEYEFNVYLVFELCEVNFFYNHFYNHMI